MYGPALFYDFQSRDMSTPETLRVRDGVGLGLGLARVRVSVTRGLARAARGSAVPADPPHPVCERSIPVSKIVILTHSMIVSKK